MASRRGRKGGTDKARDLVAVVGSLAKAGDRISADTVAARLGVTRKEALRLMDLLLSASSGSDDYLSLYSEDDDFEELVVTQDPSVTGKPLRLTRTEYLAINNALNDVGFPVDDPLRGAIGSSFGAAGVDLESVLRVIEPEGDPVVAKNLAVCGQAIADGLSVRFDYMGIVSGKKSRRHVLCQMSRLDGEYAYLDAFDLDAQANRIFRLDRMSNVELGEAHQLPEVAEVAPDDGARDIRLTFYDRGALDRVFWPDLVLDEPEGDDEDAPVTGTIPYYGGTWLPKRVAACGADVETDDEEVAALARKVAADLLEAAREAGI